MTLAGVSGAGACFSPHNRIDLTADPLGDSHVKEWQLSVNLDFHQNIPILAGYPLVITAGYDFYASSIWGPCSAEIDMNSMTGFAASVPMVFINLKS